MLFRIGRQPLKPSVPINRSAPPSKEAQARDNAKQLQALLDSPDGKLVRSYLDATRTPGLFARFGMPRNIVDLSPAADDRFRYLLVLSERGPQLLNRDSGSPAFSAGTSITHGGWLGGEKRPHPAMASIQIPSARAALARHADYLRNRGAYSPLERSYLFRTGFQVVM